MANKPTYEQLEQRVKELEGAGEPQDPAGKELQLFKAIVGASSEAIAISDPEGRLIYVNPAHERLFGRSLEEAQKLNYRDYYPPESVDILNREVVPALERGESWEGILRAHDPNGRCFSLWERADTLRDESGRMLYGFGIMHDISEQEQAKEALQKARDELELRVEERTAELLAANKKLKREVQERQQAEEALRQSEERYRKLFQSLQEGIWQIDKDAHTTLVNRPMAEMLGYTIEEMQGMHLFEFMDEEGVRIAQENLKRRESGIPEQHEFEFRGKDGKVLYALMETSPLLDEKGDYTGAVASVMDITDRKRAEAALRESEEKYRNLVESSVDGIAIVQGLRIEFVNKALLGMFGCGTLNEMVGHEFTEFVAPEHRGLMSERGRQRDGGADVPDRYEFRALRPDGTEFDAELSVATITYRGRLARQGILRDITDRKQAELALREGEEKYRGLFENSTDFVYTLDLQGCFMDVNKAAEELTGYTKAELIGMNYRDYMPSYSHRRISLAFAKVFKTGEPLQDYLLEAIVKDGSKKYFETSVTRLKKGGKIVGFQGSSRDVTKRKLAEESLKQEALRRSTLMGSCRDGIAIINQEHKVVEANERFAEMLGYTQEEILDLHTWDWEAVMTEEEIRLNFVDLTNTNAVFETRHRRKDGTIFEVEVSASGTDVDNEPFAFTISRDITKRRQAEAARRESEEKYRLLAENSLTGVFIHQDGKYVFVNQRFADIHGYTRAELIGEGALMLVHPDDRPSAKELLSTRMKGGSAPERYEIRRLRKDGSAIWCEMMANRIEYAGSPAVMGNVIDITARKTAEEALREQEAQYRGIFNHAYDAFVLMDLDGRIVEANPQACEMYGYSYEELIGLPYEGYVHPDYYHVHEKARTEVLTKGYFHGESVDVRKDGTSFYIEAKGTLIEFKGEKRMLAVIRDITERKEAEEALRESEDRFRILSQAAFEAIVIHDEGRIIQANDQYYAMFRYEPEELAGKDALKLTISSDSVTTAKEKIVQGDLGPYEVTGVKKDGTRFPIEVRIRTMDHHGRTVRMAAIRDLTDRKRAEKALKESEEKLRNVVEHSSEIFYIGDTDGVLTYVSPQSFKILGYRPDEMPREWNALLTDNPINREGLAVTKRAFETGEKQEPCLLELRAEDGSSVLLEIDESPLKDDKGRVIGITGAARDVTDKKRADDERERLEAQLRQAHKMQAIGTLAGGVAHDFNNILGIVLGNAELAMDDIPDSYPVTFNLKEIRQACLRAKDLVKQILAFSRQAAQERRLVNLVPIIKEALELLRSTIPTTIDIRQHISVASDTVLADSTQIHQVLINLCANAAQAMSEEGGVLDVSLEGLRLDEEEATQYPDLEPGDYVVLTVTDTGNGIDPGIAERIFEPYFTTKEVGQGSGMGLAVVHGIVRSHGGTITLDSVPGKGATFRVFFPLVEGEAEPEALSPEAIVGGSERVLFVDDEESLVGLAKAILKQLGYDVIATRGSLEALDVFRNEPDRFDLVITDMTMPHMTGDRLAEEMMKIRPDIPVILCTGYSDRIDEEKARAMGIRAFLLKPILKNDVAKTIRRVLDE